MKQIGGWMAIFGVGSFVLNMLGQEFILLMWIDSWGPTVGMGIRIGLIVVGGALWYFGNQQEAEEAEDA